MGIAPLKSVSDWWDVTAGPERASFSSLPLQPGMTKAASVRAIAINIDFRIIVFIRLSIHIENR
jgi:hypothetical protein